MGEEDFDFDLTDEFYADLAPDGEAPVVVTDSKQKENVPQIVNGSSKAQNNKDLDHVQASESDDFDEDEDISRVEEDQFQCQYYTPSQAPHPSGENGPKNSTPLRNDNLRRLQTVPLFTQHQIMGPPVTPNVPKASKGAKRLVSPSISNSREAFFANLCPEEERSLEERLSSVKRRFPGPAGLLPLMTPDETKLLSDASHPLSQHISKIISIDLARIKAETESSVSRKSGTALSFGGLDLLKLSDCDHEILRINRGPWKALLKTLKLDPNDPNGLLKLMNVEWVDALATSTKIPFLALVVEEQPESLRVKRKNLTRKTPARQAQNPSVKLMDSTGWVTGSVESTFIEDYGAELRPGTAIAMKNVGFLKFKSRILIGVTRRNIICVTSVPAKREVEAEKEAEASKSEPRVKFVCTSKDGSELQQSIESQEEPEISETIQDGIKIIKFSEFSPSEAFASYHKIMNELKEQQAHQHPAPVPNLFSTVSAGNLAGTARRPVTVQIPSSSAPQMQPLRNIFTAPMPGSSSNVVDTDWGDDDDEELMAALEQVDFLADN